MWGGRRHRTWTVRKLAVPLAVVLLAPGATAAMTLELTPPDEPVFPETELGALDWTATIDCTDLTTGDPGSATGETVLMLEVDHPDTASAVGPRAHIVDLSPCTTDPLGTTTLSDGFDLVVTRHAPARTDLPIHISATLDRPGAMDEVATINASADTAFQADVYFHPQAKVAQKIVQTSGGPVAFDVELTNFGNSPIRVTAALADAPDDAATWFQGADPLALEWSGAETGDAGIQTLRFQVPEPAVWTNAQAAFSFELAPTFEDQEGDPVTLNVLIRHRGSSLSQDSPGPGALLLVPALAAAALLLRRRL